MGEERESRPSTGRGLLQEEGFAEEVIEALGQGVAIFGADGRFEYVNPAGAEMVGRSPEALVGMRPFDIAHPDDHQTLLEAREQREAGERSTYEARLLKPDGTIVYVQVTGVARWNGDEVAGVYAIVTDLTEHRRAVQEIEAQQQFIQRVFDTNPNILYVFDLDEGRIIFENRHVAAVLGYTAAEMTALGANALQQMVHSDDVARVEAHLAALRTAADDDVLDIECRVRRKEGGWRWFFSRHAVFKRTADGRVQQVIGAATDITEKLQTEEELRRSEARYRSVVEDLPGLLCRFKPGGIIEFVNEAYAQTFGMAREEVIGRSFLPLIPETHREMVKADLAAMTPESPVMSQEHPVVVAGGDVRWYRWTNRLLTDEAGNAVAYQAFGRDVTRRRRAEAALRESEEMLRLFIEHAPAALAMFDREMRYLAVSQRWMADYRLGDQDVIGRSHYEVFPEVPARWKGAHRRGLAGEIVRGEEDSFVRMDGRVQWLRWEIRPWSTAEGEVGGIVIFTEDITERKRTEEQISELQEILAEAQSIAQIGSWKWDLASQKVTWSEEMFNLFGVEREDFDGDLEPLINSRIHPDDVDAVNRSNLTVLREHAPEPLEYRIVLPDGRERTVWAEGRLTYDQSGEPVALVGYVQDITARKRAEEALRASRAQLQHILNTVPQGVLLLAADGDVLLANPVAEQYLAILAPDWEKGPLTLLGDRPLQELLRPPSQGLWHTIEAGRESFEAIARPMEDEHNLGWVLVLRDVTQEREFQNRVQQQERLASVGQLAAGIAHDFNNIIAVITLYAEVMTRTVEMPARAQERLHTIEQQANRASDLIQQILDFSRQSVMERQPLDLLPFMKEMVKLLSRTLPESIQVELAYQGDAFMVLADPSRLQQVMMNLAVNARDAMPDGGELQIALAQLPFDGETPPPLPEMPAGDWVEIRVADTGSGIPARVLPQIFEPFFTTKEVGQGSGLGLAQVFGIVQQHEGFIDVSTKVGEGTTFVLYFPVLETGDGAALPGGASVQRGRGQLVLLIEDDPEVREALADSLTLMNYSVLEAANGRDALALLEMIGDDVDVVLSDVVMPEMGGLEFLRTMRQGGLTLPVIFLTGHPLSGELKEAQALGLAGWLPKPPTLAQLSGLLAQVLATY